MRSYGNGFIVGVVFFFLQIQNKENEIWEGKEKKNVKLGITEIQNSKKKKKK